MAGGARPETTSVRVLGWLRALSGPNAGRSWDLSEDRNLIGSDAICGIQLEDPATRPRHASILYAGGSFVLTRTDSAADVRINGAAADQAELLDGAVVEIGNSRFRFRCLSAEDIQSEANG